MTIQCFGLDMLLAMCTCLEDSAINNNDVRRTWCAPSCACLANAVFHSFGGEENQNPSRQSLGQHQLHSMLHRTNEMLLSATVFESKEGHLWLLKILRLLLLLIKSDVPKLVRVYPLLIPLWLHCRTYFKCISVFSMNQLNQPSFFCASQISIVAKSPTFKRLVDFILVDSASESRFAAAVHSSTTLGSIQLLAEELILRPMGHSLWTLCVEPKPANLHGVLQKLWQSHDIIHKHRLDNDSNLGPKHSLCCRRRLLLCQVSDCFLCLLHHQLQRCSFHTIYVSSDVSSDLLGIGQCMAIQRTPIREQSARRILGSLQCHYNSIQLFTFMGPISRHVTPLFAKCRALSR